MIENEVDRRILLLKKNGVKYYMIEWNISYHMDKKDNFLVISGMDYNGMFFQIKADKIIDSIEYGNWTEMQI